MDNFLRTCVGWHTKRTTGGGIQPRWRADGKELYFVAPEGKLMAASITAAGATFSADTPVPLVPVVLVPGMDAENQQYAVLHVRHYLIIQHVETSTTAPTPPLMPRHANACTPNPGFDL